jgi:DNA polymerase-3 subunit delta'
VKFSAVPGQESVKQLLFSALSNNRLAHGYRIEGGEGLGQLAFALALAQRLNCTQPDGLEPCGGCQQCRLTLQLQHPDVQWIYPIAAKGTGGKPTLSEDYIEAFRAAFAANAYLTPDQWAKHLDAENKQLNIPIAEIRELQKRVYLKPYLASRKVVVIWSADKMNLEASNAFLKLLEEPPDQTTLLLILEGTAELLPTLTSRTQALPLKRVSRTELTQFLVNQCGYSEDAASVNALLSEGHIARALELGAEQDASISDEFQAWMRLCYEGKFVKLNEWCSGQVRKNREYQKIFLKYAILRFRDSTMVSFTLNDVVFASPSEREFLVKFSRVLNSGSAELLTGLVESAQHYLRRNLSPLMVWVNLSLQIHDVLKYRG